MSAGVVLVHAFATSESRTFSNYIEYIDRDSAKNNLVSQELIQELGSYGIDYIGNSKKTNNVFSSMSDSLSQEEKHEAKDIFKLAQNNKSVMWQSVFSFDNDFLAEHGLYNLETKSITSENSFKNYVRNAVEKMYNKENLNDSIFYTAAVHYNTDNVHVHIAAVEPEPTRKKQTIQHLTVSSDFIKQTELFKNRKFDKNTFFQKTATKNGHFKLYNDFTKICEENFNIQKNNLGGLMKVNPDNSITIVFKDENYKGGTCATFDKYCTVNEF